MRKPSSCSLSWPMTLRLTDATSAQAAWQALKDLYDRETVNTTINLLKNVTERKLADGAFLQDHLTGFHNDWIRLKERSFQGKGNSPKPCKLSHPLTRLKLHTFLSPYLLRWITSLTRAGPYGVVASGF